MLGFWDQLRYCEGSMCVYCWKQDPMWSIFLYMRDICLSVCLVWYMLITYFKIGGGPYKEYTCSKWGKTFKGGKYWMILLNPSPSPVYIHMGIYKWYQLKGRSKSHFFLIKERIMLDLEIHILRSGPLLLLWLGLYQSSVRQNHGILSFST